MKFKLYCIDSRFETLLFDSPDTIPKISNVTRYVFKLQSRKLVCVWAKSYKYFCHNWGLLSTTFSVFNYNRIRLIYLSLRPTKDIDLQRIYGLINYRFPPLKSTDSCWIMGVLTCTPKLWIVNAGENLSRQMILNYAWLLSAPYHIGMLIAFPELTTT